jgi:adenine-specific DNA-methyltransferase
MRYFGSKASTLDVLLRLVRSYIPHGTLCDPFGGIATVGAHFKTAGYQVITGDQLTFATYFQIARIEYSRTPSFRNLRQVTGLMSSQDVAQHLDALPPADGWFVAQYAGKRRFYSRANAQRIEAVRRQIQTWHDDGLLSARERAFLLASLIHCADKVANTAGTYYAYLKRLHRKAKNVFCFELLRPAKGQPGRSYRADAVDLVRRRAYDVLYLDPPYNERCYSGYYHLPETLATLRRWKPVHGKSGVPTQLVRSGFNSHEAAKRSLAAIVNVARFKLLVFHYSDDGLISPKEVRAILHKRGLFRSYQLTSSGYTTKNLRRQITHRVYVVENL